MKRLATHLCTSAAALLLAAFACGDRPPDPEGEEGSPLEEPDSTNTASTSTATTADPTASNTATPGDSTGTSAATGAEATGGVDTATATDGSGGSGGL